MYFVYKDYNDLCYLYKKYLLSVIAFEKKRHGKPVETYEEEKAEDIGWVQHKIIEKTKKFYALIDSSIEEIKWRIDRTENKFLRKNDRLSPRQREERIRRLRLELVEHEKAKQWYIGPLMFQNDNPFYIMDL